MDFDEDSKAFFTREPYSCSPVADREYIPADPLNAPNETEKKLINEVHNEQQFRMLIIDKFGLDEKALASLIVAGIDYSNIQYLNDRDIEAIFPLNIGHRCRFRWFFKKWLKSQNKTNELIALAEEAESSRSSTENALEKKTLLSILQSNAKGTRIISNYAQTHELTDANRKYIIDTVVDSFYNNNIHMTTKTIKMFSRQVVQLFPTESLDYYFVAPSEGKRASGKMFYRAHNVARKMRKEIGPITDKSDSS